VLTVSADENTVVMTVNRVLFYHGGLTLVLGCLHQDDGSSVTTRDDSGVYGLFNRHTVSRCHIEPGSVVAIHPPW